MSISDDWRRIAERFRAVPRDDDKKCVQAIAGDAAYAIRQGDVMSRLGIEIEGGWTWPPSGPVIKPEDDQRNWFARWQTLVMLIQGHFRERFRSDVEKHGETLLDNWAENGTRITQVSIGKDEWRQRALEWAGICDFIADQLATPVTGVEKTESDLANILDDQAPEISAIASNAALGVDAKMRRIAIVKSEAVAWNSRKWASLLEVSDSLIRQQSTWKTWRETEKKAD